MFQSTRPRGARLGLDEFYEYELEFQSTRPRGARPLCACVFQSIIHVSIHAPAWGATIKANGGTITQKFQSTRPRGARLNHFISSLQSLCFNPRARVGRDVQRK